MIQLSGMPGMGSEYRPKEGFLHYTQHHKVGSGIGGPTRSKHFLWRYHSLKQRIRSGEVTLVHVPDPQMPADFLTKWIPRTKLEQSLRYACNSHGTSLDLA